MYHPTRTASSWLILTTLLFLFPLEAQEKKAASQSDEEAISAAVRSYVEAYNRGDAKAVAEHWSDKGEWISPDGEKFTGKEAIAGALKSLFEENKGTTIEVKDPVIRLVSPEVAIEEGAVTVMSPTQQPSKSSYLAIHVKKDGKWKLESVRETDIPEAPAQSVELDDLGWLVGEWIDVDPEAQNEAKVSWTKNKTFLNYSFKVSVSDSDDLEGSQIIGWDPAAGTIRSWMFDSDGGFGEGTWTRKGDSWMVKFSQVLPDGSTATATNIYTIIDANTFTWKSIGRSVDGEFQPNVEEVKIVRKGTHTAAKPETKTETNDKTTANTEGNNSLPAKKSSDAEKSNETANP